MVFVPEDVKGATLLLQPPFEMMPLRERGFV